MKGVYGRDLLTVTPERHRPVTVASEACPICLSHSGLCLWSCMYSLEEARCCEASHLAFALQRWGGSVG